MVTVTSWGITRVPRRNGIFMVPDRHELLAEAFCNFRYYLPRLPALRPCWHELEATLAPFLDEETTLHDRAYPNVAPENAPTNNMWIYQTGTKTASHPLCPIH